MGTPCHRAPINSNFTWDIHSLSALYGFCPGGQPLARAVVQYAYAFGASKVGISARVPDLGLNEDEQERLVFDGLIVHIAGGKRGGDFNQRLQPSSTLKPSIEPMDFLFPLHR